MSAFFGASSGSERPLSVQAAKARRRWPLAVLFGAFAVMGLVATYFFLVKPMLTIWDARHWIPTPCTVISSRVATHEGDEGDTYSVEIVYAYQYNGREYRSDRYHAFGGSSSGYQGKKVIVARYPDGSTTECFVNPNAPSEALLERGYPLEVFFGLIPILFAVIGVGGLVYLVMDKAGSRKSEPAMNFLPEPRPRGQTFSPGGMVELKPASSRRAKMAIMFAAAAFWNGIVSIFIVQAADEWRSGSFPVGLSLFLIPFVLAGLGLIGAFFYQLLASFNAGIRIMVRAAAVPLGGTLELCWNATGPVRALQSFRLSLEGREEATHGSGEDQHTTRQVFKEIELCSTRDLATIRTGRVAVTIPPDTMHSFKTPHNVIAWTIKVSGQVRRWPDINDEYPIVILPGRGNAA